MNKNILVVIILGVIIVVLFALLFLPESSQAPSQQNNTPSNGIEIFSPKTDERVTSPLKIIGKISGNGWTGFEGQVGVVKLFDERDNQLALGILTATANWMQLPTPFETTLFFDYPSEGLGKLVFYNENASGEPERNKTFTLPVMLAQSSKESMKVRAYFSNSQMDPEVSCNKVVPIEKEVAKANTPARAALEVLLSGLTDMQKDAGFSTSINQGVIIQSLVIDNGVAKVDFNQALQQGVGGSCRVSAIRAQITETLKQFPTVKSVIISIDGNTAEILQP